MIFTNIAEIKAFIPTTMLSIDYLAKHETRAIRKHFPKYLGITLTNKLLAENPSEKISALIYELKGAIANLAYLEAIPFIDVISTKSGFGIVSNGNTAPASTARVNSFKDACLSAAKDYINDTLYFLETNIADYPEWNKSCLNENGLIEKIDDWPDELGNKYNRLLFVETIKSIKKYEDNWINDQLSIEFISTLSKDDVNVYPLIKMALAYMAISDFDNDDDEEANHIALAHAYMAKAVTYLNDHLIDYPEYESHGYILPFENDLEENGFIRLG